jgi:hypothetical protein
MMEFLNFFVLFNWIKNDLTDCSVAPTKDAAILLTVNVQDLCHPASQPLQMIYDLDIGQQRVASLQTIL